MDFVIHTLRLAELAKNGICITRYSELNKTDRKHLEEYFINNLEPVCTPLAVDPGHPFPYLTTLTLNIAVLLRGLPSTSMIPAFELAYNFLCCPPAPRLADPVDDSKKLAIVAPPHSAERWVKIPPHDGSGSNSSGQFSRQQVFVSCEDIIMNNLSVLFGGMKIEGSYLFRVTRNADVARNEDEAEDLLDMITEEMRERKLAPFVRLEVAIYDLQ